MTGSNEAMRRAGVIVYTRCPDGLPDDDDKGALNEGVRLAKMLRAPLQAVLIAHSRSGEEPVELENLTKAFAAYGVERLCRATCKQSLADYPDACAQALAQVVNHTGASIVLLAHNDEGSALAPELAAALGGALVTECQSTEVTEKALVLGRSHIGRRAMEKCRWNAAVPLVITLDSKATSAALLPSVAPGMAAIEDVEVVIDGAAFAKVVVERIPPDPQTVDVSEAQVIFCAGKGFDPESFEHFKELARLLNASLGVTRPVYDMGWTGFERMIGQTGKTVAPGFYFGMGISGSMHHIGGIKDSRKLFSLNIDPKVPMFPNSDEGFVADLKEVLPILLDKVRARVGGQEGGAA